MPEYGFSLNRSLREKCPNTEFFLVRISPVFSSNAGKYGPEKTPYLDTFARIYPVVYFCMKKIIIDSFRFCPYTRIYRSVNYVKNDQIQRIFWSVFSCSPTEYRKIRTRKTSVFGNFSRNGESPYSGIFYIASVKQGSSYPFSRI